MSPHSQPGRLQGLVPALAALCAAVVLWVVRARLLDARRAARSGPGLIDDRAGAAVAGARGPALRREATADLLAGGRLDAQLRCAAGGGACPAAVLRVAGLPRGAVPGAPDARCGSRGTLRGLGRGAGLCHQRAGVPGADLARHRRAAAGRRVRGARGHVRGARGGRRRIRDAPATAARLSAHARWTDAGVLREEFRGLDGAGAGLPVLHRLGASLAGTAALGILRRRAAAPGLHRRMGRRGRGAARRGAFAACPVLEQPVRARAAARRARGPELLERPPQLAGQVPARTAALSAAVDDCRGLRAGGGVARRARRRAPRAPPGASRCAPRSPGCCCCRSLPRRAASTRRRA